MEASLSENVEELTGMVFNEVFLKLGCLKMSKINRNGL